MGLQKQVEAGEMELGSVAGAESRSLFQRLRNRPRVGYSFIPRCQSVHKAVL
jgi:hypothetical protein